MAPCRGRVSPLIGNMLFGRQDFLKNQMTWLLELKYFSGFKTSYSCILT